jgi:hypothetical protein
MTSTCPGVDVVSELRGERVSKAASLFTPRDVARVGCVVTQRPLERVPANSTSAIENLHRRRTLARARDPLAGRLAAALAGGTLWEPGSISGRPVHGPAGASPNGQWRHVPAANAENLTMKSIDVHAAPCEIVRFVIGEARIAVRMRRHRRGPVPTRSRTQPVATARRRCSGWGPWSKVRLVGGGAM